MKNLNKLTVIALLSVSTFFASCSKEPIQGPAGKDGVNGNANVESSKETVTWTKLSSKYMAYASNTKISYDILDKGMVQVYANLKDGQVQLPITLTNVGFFRTIDFRLENGGIFFYVTDSDGQIRNTPEITEFKIITTAGN